MPRSRLALSFALSLLLAGPAQSQAVSGAWTYGVPLPSPQRTSAATAVLDGKVYVLGGLDSRGKALAAVDVFDSEGGEWSAVASLNSARYNAAAVAYGDRVCVLGGRDRSGDVLDSIECYDPGQESWSELQELETEREGLVAAVIGDRLFALGGADENGVILSSIERYDAASDEWETLPAELPLPVVSAAAAVVDDAVYVFGGYALSGVPLPVRAIQKYEPGTGRTTHDALELGRALGSPAVAASGGVIFIAGGTTQSGSTADAFTYTPSSGVLAPAPPLQTARTEATAVSLRGSLFVVGGRTEGRSLAPLHESVEIFMTSTGAPPADEYAAFHLESPAPNPFRDRTHFTFGLAASGEAAVLAVYDATGRHVRTLHSGHLAAGQHRQEWDASDDQGRPVSSGLYYAELKQGAHRLVRPVIVVR